MAVHLSTIAFMPKKDKPNWPTPVPSGRYEPGLSVSQLSAQQKNALWLHLKSQHPQKAMEITEIMDDPTFHHSSIFIGNLYILEKR